MDSPTVSMPGSNTKVTGINGKEKQSSPDRPLTPESMNDVSILDIRRDTTELNLKEEIIKLLNPEYGPKQMPTLLLYDERGLQLFEKVSICHP